jgi:phospholipase/carboxylesterase
LSFDSRRGEGASLSRRAFLLTATTMVLGLAGCQPALHAPGRAGAGRFSWRPHRRNGRDRPPIGLHPLGVGGERESLLYVPPSMPPDRPAPLVVAFHGAGRSASAMSGLHRFQAAADATGVALAAPASRGPTWDGILGSFGPDIEVTDDTLRAANAVLDVDPDRVALAGYSDGASYALSLGITNGDVVTHVIACSPGFVAETDPHGRPKVFISHGTEDPVLPIDSTSRKIVPTLEDAGYDVTFVEFSGRHEVPPSIALQAFAWFADVGTG